jgi:hypothetical protein
LKFTLVALVFLAEPAAGRISIDSVTVLPGALILPYKPVSIEVVVYSTTVPVFPFQPTEIHVTENEIAIDMFLDAGDGDAITYETQTVDLGTLQPGSYAFSVTLIPGPNTFGGGVSHGNFQVVNLVPTVSDWGLVVMTFLLLTVGTAALARRRRRILPSA